MRASENLVASLLTKPKFGIQLYKDTIIQFYNDTIFGCPINMQIELDFRSGIPIYVQIMDQIKHLIASGVLHSGDQLPTVRQLATDLRVNFNTVARAYRLLDEAGMISTQHGRGTYILEEPEHDSDKLRKQALEGLTRSYLAESHRLGFSPDEVSELFGHFVASWKEDGTPPLSET